MTHRTTRLPRAATRSGLLRRRLGADGSPPAVPRPAREPQRHRAAGGPDDIALYTCSCGAAFDADVSAAVACPACGTEQAW